jgi:valine--pyruvate aminotransferase
MTFSYSEIGQRLTARSGIVELMDDLGHALAGGAEMKMLGGGQPAQIPEMNATWQRRLVEMLAEPGGMEQALTRYDPPAGNRGFRDAVAGLFRSEFGWPLSGDHVAVTAGGQAAFFQLFNLLAGPMPDGSHKRILLPLVPEYIGYADQGLDEGLFHSVAPRILEMGPHEFKYAVDFDELEVTPDIAAICASRPTNPTGNVLTDAEVAHLSDLAKRHGIPLILDNAYGAPFPGIIFAEATPFWDEHVILTLSLSKLGLPATRTGIVIGPPEIIRAMSSMNAITGLSNTNIGQQITLPLLESGEILRLSREVVRPFYQEKCQRALAAVAEAFREDFPWRVHRAEGALFLWLWFPGLPVSSAELYERLKRRGVLVIPGHYFFFGLDDRDWRHRQECVRLSYAMDEQVVHDGLRILAEEVRACFAAAVSLPGAE